MGVTVTFPAFVLVALLADILVILTSDNEKQIAKIKVQAVSDTRTSFKDSGQESEAMREGSENSVLREPA